MIDSYHKMAGLVADLMQYIPIREPSTINFPDNNDPTETPSSLGFSKWWKPFVRNERRLVSKRSITRRKTMCSPNICKDLYEKWYAYIVPGWKNGPFQPSPDQPAIADNVSILKRLAGLVGAPVCYLKWNMHDKRVGDFTGEVIMSRKGSCGGEKDRFLRCFITDCSFRIAWYANELEKILFQCLASGVIQHIPGFVSRDRDKLKDHMRISVEVPEAEPSIFTIMDGLDIYDIIY